MHQFCLRQLLLATALIAAYAWLIAHAALGPTGNRSSSGMIAGAIIGLLPTIGGLIGLARNDGKGMLLGVVVGIAMTVVLAALFGPGVR